MQACFVAAGTPGAAAQIAVMCGRQTQPTWGYACSPAPLTMHWDVISACAGQVFINTLLFAAGEPQWGPPQPPGASSGGPSQPYYAQAQGHPSQSAAPAPGYGAAKPQPPQAPPHAGASTHPALLLAFALYQTRSDHILMKHIRLISSLNGFCSVSIHREYDLDVC